MNIRTDIVTVGLVVLVLAGMMPSIAVAQGTTAGAIAGVVRDTTGALLPGVTVEAASPALIEKVRVAVTNDQGQYQIVDLRPGAYVVTFTLTGFRPFRREGVELTAGYTANITANLELGGLEETITVSGLSPLVDIRTTAQSETFTREKMDELPTTKNFASMAVLIPGVSVAGVAGSQQTQDVGGTMGERNPTLTYHGSASGDMPQHVDGFPVNNASGTGAGGFLVWVPNNGIIEETVIGTAGFTAETTTSGVQINQITRSGGNQFSGTFFGAYTNDRFQSDNLNDRQRAVGLSRYITKKIWDFNPAVGGPLLRDRVWFFYSYRHWGTNDQPAGTYFDATPLDFVFDPDRSRPAVPSSWVIANNARLTWQIAPKHKLGLYADSLGGGNSARAIGPNLAPEAAQWRKTPMNHFVDVTWNAVLSNRLLLEAGQVRKGEDFNYYQYDAFEKRRGPTFDGIQVVDSGKGVTYRALGPTALSRSYVYPGRASMSYVTGSHHLKVGTQWNTAQTIVENNKVWSNTGAEYAYTFVNGVPTSVTYVAPAVVHDSIKLSLGVFAQDQWTVKRLTMNLGVRFDHHNAYTPAQHVPATAFVGARDFPEYNNRPDWNDIEPRLGAAYDLFGTGKTAVI